MCNGSLDSNCGAFATVKGCHCQKPLYYSFNLQKIKKYILPFGKCKKGFGKTVFLLLQLVMNWNDNQIIPSRASVGQIPLPTIKWKKCGKLSICPPDIDSSNYRTKLVHILLKVVTSKKSPCAGWTVNQYLQRVWICLGLLLLWELSECVLAKERRWMALL